MEKHTGPPHPFDTLLAGGLRFGSELIAWIAGPWAAALVAPWLVVPTLVVLVGLPSVFSTHNDKRKIIVATPGPLRVLIELLLYAVASVAPWLVWSTPLAISCSAIVVGSVVLGAPRTLWLLRGANAMNAERAQ
jgi:hypothetical protein